MGGTHRGRVGLVGAVERGSLAGRVERSRAECAQEVIGAAGEFAGDGQRRAVVREAAVLEGVVVGVVGAALMRGGLGGLIERPAQGC
jgi:hypothetical protein